MKTFTATLNPIEAKRLEDDFSQLTVYAESTILNEPANDEPGFRKITITINSNSENCELAIDGSRELADKGSRSVDFLKTQGWFSKVQEV